MSTEGQDLEMMEISIDRKLVTSIRINAYLRCHTTFEGNEICLHMLTCRYVPNILG